MIKQSVPSPLAENKTKKIKTPRKTKAKPEVAEVLSSACATVSPQVQKKLDVKTKTKAKQSNKKETLQSVVDVELIDKEQTESKVATDDHLLKSKDKAKKCEVEFVETLAPTELEEQDDDLDADGELAVEDLDPAVDLLTFPSELIDDSEILPALRIPSSPAIRDALYAYMQTISKFPLIHPDEEQELARRALNNDKEAAFRLISAHLRLVVKIAMEFQRRWMQNVLDLIQEGNVGLIRAVNKFDPEKGIKFSYYASFWIKAFILKFIMDNWRMVKIGTTQAQRKLFYNLNREKQRLIALGFNPDSEMLAKHLNVSKDDIIDMEQRLDSQDSSLDLTVSQDGEGASRIDFLPALGPGVEENIATSEIAFIVREKLSLILPRLSDKEVCILNERLLSDDPVTLREIGERYNITRERVRQIETRLLQKLKEFLTKDIQDFSEDWIEE